MDETLGTRLRMTRAALGMKQSSVEVTCELHSRILSRYERGSFAPPIDTLIKLADFYGVTLDWLAGRKSAATPSFISGTDEDMPKDEWETVKKCAKAAELTPQEVEKVCRLLRDLKAAGVTQQELGKICHVIQELKEGGFNA